MTKHDPDSVIQLNEFTQFPRQPELAEVQRCALPIISHWLRSSGCVKVLDLGCGEGAVAARLAEERFSVVGMDSSRQSLALAEEHARRVEFVHADIERPLPRELRGEFDAVIAIDVIEHLPCPRILLQRAREALVGGGRVILTTPYYGYWKNLVLALANRFDAHWNPLKDGGHVKFFSPATLSRLVQEERFSISRVTRVGRVPTLARSIVCEGLLK